MAVCQFSTECDVYVYYSSGGGIECCRCELTQDHMFNAPDEASMLSHLREHVAAGHKVPAIAFQRLENPEPE